MSAATFIPGVARRVHSNTAHELLLLIHVELRHLAAHNMAGEAPGQALPPVQSHGP